MGAAFVCALFIEVSIELGVLGILGMVSMGFILIKIGKEFQRIKSIYNRQKSIDRAYQLQLENMKAESLEAYRERKIQEYCEALEQNQKMQARAREAQRYIENNKRCIYENESTSLVAQMEKAYEVGEFIGYTYNTAFQLFSIL